MKTTMSTKTLLTAGTILMTTFAANAQRQAPPQGTAPKPFTVPAHETYTLANGMKVTLVPYGKIPKVTVSAVVNTGNVDEPAELTGLADLMGTLMKEGTKTRSSKRVAEEFASMGGSLDLNVGPDESDVATDVLSEFAPKAIALGIALERFRKLLYGQHPYGTVFASEESVNKSTLVDVKKFYETNFGAQR